MTCRLLCNTATGLVYIAMPSASTVLIISCEHVFTAWHEQLHFDLYSKHTVSSYLLDSLPCSTPASQQHVSLFDFMLMVTNLVADTHLMSEVQQSRQERSQAAKVSNGASLASPRAHSGDAGSDKLFVLPVLTTSGSATFNLTLNSQNAATHSVKKITLFLKQNVDESLRDLDVFVAVSSWTSNTSPAITTSVSPEALPESFENYLDEPYWIEYDMTQVLMDAAQYERLNMIVVSSRTLKFSKAYLRVDYDDGQVSAPRSEF